MDPAIVGALVATAGTLGAGALGAAFARRRHRLAWEEEAQGELAKVRQQALLRMLDALAALVVAKYDLTRERGYHDADPSPANRADLERADAAEDDAAYRYDQALTANLFLLPADVRAALREAGDAIHGAPTPDAVSEALARAAPVLDRYLPDLPTKR
jgi:lysozyme family protein